MEWLLIGSNTFLNLDELIRIDFKRNQENPLGEEANLLLRLGDRFVSANEGSVASIPALQQLREFTANGSGENGWVRVGSEAATTNQIDSYVNLRKVSTIRFVDTSSGRMARLKAFNGIGIGQAEQAMVVATLSRIVNGG